MITEALMSVVKTIVQAVLGVIQAIPVPDWVTSGSGAIATVFQFVSSMGTWFPLGLILTVLAAYLGIKAAAFGIKVARIVASFATGGGGSAA